MTRGKKKMFWFCLFSTYITMSHCQKRTGLAVFFPGWVVSHAISTEGVKYGDQYLHQWFSDKCLCFLLPLILPSPICLPMCPIYLHLALLCILETCTLVPWERHHVSIFTWCDVTSLYSMHFLSHFKSLLFYVLPFLSCHFNSTIQSPLQSFPISYSLIAMSYLSSLRIAVGHHPRSWRWPPDPYKV